MNNEEFMITVEQGHLRSKKVLTKKRIEYSGDEDRLEQFWRVGVAQNISPTEALMGMATKHVTSIADMCKDPGRFDIRKWNEKIGDLRNYTHLLDALVRDMESEDVLG